MGQHWSHQVSVNHYYNCSLYVPPNAVEATCEWRADWAATAQALHGCESSQHALHRSFHEDEERGTQVKGWLEVIGADTCFKYSAPEFDDLEGFYKADGLRAGVEILHNDAFTVEGEYAREGIP